jgi:predicted unusual protein kinase regulating ubiquinone biosynthesis (AarF/ABC1/UbiB family)
MGEDWSKLGGESGEEIPTSRFKRALSMGTMGARVTASTLAGKIGSMVLPASKEKRDEMLRAAYVKNAQTVVETLGKLKGASLKLGQLVSADPELIPAEFAEVMSSLQRSAPPMTYETVVAQIEKAYDRPMETLFSYFDPDPVGAASIGQVHRARLEDGQEVAVKVQYPRVAESLDSDLKTLRSMLNYGRAVIEKQRLNAYLEEVRNVVMTEADYRIEAENLARFYELMAERPGVRTPRPMLELARETVVVMEFMEGRPLEEALREMEDLERRDAILLRWVELFSWMFHEVHELHADPHPGNFLLDENDELVMLDFGCIKRFDPAFTDGFLDVLDASWQGDHARALQGYMALGFGTRGNEDARVDPALMGEYNQIVLAPFMTDEVFEFASWSPAKDAKMFMLRHPSMFALTPPSDALPYFRVLSGIKGLLAKLDARLSVKQMAVETARRRGRLTS